MRGDENSYLDTAATPKSRPVFWRQREHFMKNTIATTPLRGLYKDSERRQPKNLRNRPPGTFKSRIFFSSHMPTESL